MDSRVLELANQIKSLAVRIKIEKRKDLSFKKVDELSDITTLDNLIWLCNEITNIGESEPIGYISPVGLVNIRRNQPVLISQSKSKSTIPLYRLDK